MLKRNYYTLAIVSFLLIPVVAVIGGLAINFINPEIAAGHPDYVRNFHLLVVAKHVLLWAALALIAGLWFLGCFFLVKSRIQSYAWLPLAILGPIGLIVLTMLGDKRPAPGDSYRRFVGRLKIYQRVSVESCIFVAAWCLAYEIVDWKRELMILIESAWTVTPKEEIIALQAASGGMWAFSDGLQVFFLVVLIYLLWPICFNAIDRLLKSRDAAKNA